MDTIQITQAILWACDRMIKRMCQPYYAQPVGRRVIRNGEGMTEQFSPITDQADMICWVPCRLCLIGDSPFLSENHLTSNGLIQRGPAQLVEMT
jgi:hypothetical protein